MNVEYEISRETKPELEIIDTGGVKFAHMHNPIEIIVVTKGVMAVTEGGVTKQLEENEAAIADSYTPHAYEKNDGNTAVVLIIPEYYLADYRAVMRGKTFSDPFLPAAGGARVRKLIELLEDEPQQSLAARGLVNAILGEFTRFLTPTDRISDPSIVMRDALLYLSDNFTEPITLSALAKQFGYAPTHFSRIFNAYTGTNLNGFLGNLRAEYAAGLLRSGQSVTDAAMNAGFASIRTFYRAFRKKYGVCPRALGEPGVDPDEMKIR